MRTKQPAAIITGPMASPSSPSVRLTAFDDPTITSMAKGRNPQPKSISMFFMNGMARLVDKGAPATSMIHRAVVAATRISEMILTLADRPWWLWRTSFR